MKSEIKKCSAHGCFYQLVDGVLFYAAMLDDGRPDHDTETGEITWVEVLDASETSEEIRRLFPYWTIPANIL